MPMRYQLATPARLNQSGMEPRPKGRGSSAGAVAAPASAGETTARFLENLTRYPPDDPAGHPGVATSYTLGLRAGTAIGSSAWSGTSGRDRGSTTACACGAGA